MKRVSDWTLGLVVIVLAITAVVLIQSAMPIVNEGLARLSFLINSF
jgi:cytochrome b subunit of formate dehydrogenase